MSHLYFPTEILECFGIDSFKNFGFSEDEILKLKRYAKNNSSLIWDFAQKGGGENA